jgi:hypothetical protein
MASPSSSFSPFTAARVVKADPAFLTRPHADASILALAALLNPTGIDAEQVQVNQKLVRNMFVHEEVLNILKRPWEHNKDQPIISACCLLLKRVLLHRPFLIFFAYASLTFFLWGLTSRIVMLCLCGV